MLKWLIEVLFSKSCCQTQLWNPHLSPPAIAIPNWRLLLWDFLTLILVIIDHYTESLFDVNTGIIPWILQMQHGRLEEVPLPSAQYVLDVEEEDVLVIDRSVSVVRGLCLGHSRVVLRDRHSLDSESGLVRLPTASITVTEPAYLRLSLLPHNSWAVLVDEPCSIQVQLFDRFVYLF